MLAPIMGLRQRSTQTLADRASLIATQVDPTGWSPSSAPAGWARSIEPKWSRAAPRLCAQQTGGAQARPLPPPRQKVSLKRFLREVEIGKTIRHPNVVPTYDAGVHARKGQYLHYLVMEYVEGQTLRALLGEMGRVPEELCRHVAREVAKGSTPSTPRVVHRDLKPENVLITQDEVVKVMDLGVARLQDEALRLSQAGQFVGSVLYAAPEQIERGGEEDRRPRGPLRARARCSTRSRRRQPVR